jgi:hypothetical protein
VWALVATPFRAFTYASSWVITIAFVVLYLIVTFVDPKRWPELLSTRNISVYSWVAAAAFVFGLWFRVLPFPDLTLGSVNDSALHTLFVYSIIYYGGIPPNLPAVAPIVLQFPQGLHVVLAYFTMISGLPPELVTFYELAFFNATIILGAYTFCSVIFSREYAMIVGLLLAGISVTPIDITWGAQIIPWGLTIFFVILAFAFPTFLKKGHFPFKSENLRSLMLPGILLGYLGSVYAPLLIIIAFILFAVAIMEFQDVRNRILAFITMMTLSLPLFGLWIYRFVFQSNTTSAFILTETTSSNFNRAYVAGLHWFPFSYMTSIQGVASGIWNWISWPPATLWPGSLVLFPTLLILGAGIFVLAVLSKDHLSLPRNFLKYLIAAFIAILIWGADTPVGLFYYTGGPFSILAPELDKVAVIAGVFFLAFIAALPLYLVISRPSSVSKLIRKEHWKYVTAIVVGGLFLANFVIVPYGVYWLDGNYSVYAVASSSDYQLLQWMRTGIPQNSTVLINPYDAGQYVASVSNKTVVGIYTGVSFLTSGYENLTTLLQNNIMNETTISLISSMNVSYIFVGSRAFAYGWSPQFFINHCLTFKAVASFDTSYLFEVISTNPRVAETICEYI